MKQIAQYQDGRLELQDVPMPTAPPGGILVRVTHSVVSVGTERMKVEQARMNLIQKARARPDQVRKVLDTARTLGWPAALEKVRNRLETPTPLGYSAAGVVVGTDAACTRFRSGDRVACGGAECAFHAEYIAVPDLLAAKIPDGVESRHAAYTAIASIALQTVRQVAPSVGDRVMVMGQGLIGLLVTTFLRIAGTRVLAVDLAEARRHIALASGAERFVQAAPGRLESEIRDWTEGYGVDAVVLATATQDNGPTEQAIHALRDRGRIVVVGNTRVDLPWKTAYEREIEVRYSRSYGPGRYDPQYEWAGADYPIGHVRWTEQRNFDACLNLMRSGDLDLELLTSRRIPFTSALEMYRQLDGSAAKEVGIVLEYQVDSAERVESADAEAAPKPPARQQHPGARLPVPVNRLDVIGAGNFARTMLLPHLKGRIAFGTVVNNTSLSAQHVRDKFGFAQAGTDWSAVLHPRLPAGERNAAVLIATRHHLHGPLVREAVLAGRQVFVEKPLCLTRAELGGIDEAVANAGVSVHVGFNRRFAPASVELRRLLQATPGPKSASYRVMAGRLDPEHWYANIAESGGRVLGEACHFLDYFCFLFDSPPVQVVAQPISAPTGRLPFPDSVTVQIEFADGSSGQLIYSADGDPSWPKEQCTLYGAGLVAEITDFRSLVVHQGRRSSRRRFTSKGHRESMQAWAEFLLGHAEPPLPYEASRQSMLLTFAVLDSIREGRAVRL